MEPRAVDRRARIDDRIETVLDGPDGAAVAVARETTREPDDRWYGRLVAVTADAVAGGTDPQTAVPAGAAIELLRGYCRLRRDLFAGVADGRSGLPSPDPMAALLAGDYLYTSAYSALGSVDHAALDDCFRALSNALEAITEAFAASHPQLSGDTDRRRPDRPAASLGACAAVVGGTLAGVRADRRDTLAEFGRGIAGERAIDRLRSDADGLAVGCDVDERRLREHAQRRRADAELALRELPSAVDEETLRAFRAEPDR